MAIKCNNNKDNTKEQAQELTVHGLEVKNVRGIPDRKDCYWFTALVNGITIYDMQYITYISDKGEEKSFVDFPRVKGKDGKYYKHVWFPVSPSTLAAIENALEKALNA